MGEGLNEWSYYNTNYVGGWVNQRMDSHCHLILVGVNEACSVNSIGSPIPNILLLDIQACTVLALSQ